MKYKSIDYKKLQDALMKPDWYLVLNEELKLFLYDYKKIYDELDSDEEKEKFREKRNELLIFFAEKLSNGQIALGRNNEYFFDGQRKPIDTVVIHHTSRPTETPLEILEAIQLLNLYASEFSNKSRNYYGKSIFSGHFLEGKMTFLAYHYLIYPGGEVKNLLKDEYIGWHCGNWDYNTRSIAVTFADDLEEKEPTELAIKAAKELIAKYNPKEILGHREISDKTTCPGNLFLGENGWKKELIKQFDNSSNR